jgi:hypothetical protein
MTKNVVKNVRFLEIVQLFLMSDEGTRRSPANSAPPGVSWLNMAEIEIGILRGQCLDRRIDDPQRLINEIAARERERNTAGARIKWSFTTDKARPKMGPAYPVMSKES